MKKIFIAALLIVLALPIIGQNQDEYKFSLVPRRVAAPTLTNYITRDGTVPWTGSQTSIIIPADGAIKLQNKVGDNKVVKLGFYGI